MTFRATNLYIKRHSITGKMYFGKTFRNDVEKYIGSGSYWKKHVSKYGKEFVETIWSDTFLDEDDCKEFSEFFSEFFDIVESDQWANKIPESGIDAFSGPRGTAPAILKSNGESLGHIKSSDPRWKTGEIVGASHGRKFTDEQKINLSRGQTGKKKIRTKEHNEKIGRAQINTACAYDPVSNSFLGRIACDDPRWKTGEIVGSNAGKTLPSYTESRRKKHIAACAGINKGSANAKLASTGEPLGRISINDPRWKTGEIVGQRKKINV